MLFINEWLPNPTGPDAGGEFVELWNSGVSPINLVGWVLRTDKKHQFRLSGSVAAGGYATLSRRITKLALKNTDGELFLYDAAGALADRSWFSGAAPEGESFNRANYRADGGADALRGIQQFVWSLPTPGTKNNAAAEAGISENHYPVGVPLSPSRPGLLSVLGLAILAGVIFAVALWYAIKKDEDSSQLFFGRNEGARH